MNDKQADEQLAEDQDSPTAEPAAPEQPDSPEPSREPHADLKAADDRPARPGLAGKLFLGISIVLSLVAVAAAIWVLWQLQQTGTETSSSVDYLSSSVDSLGSSVDSLRTSVDEMETELASLQQQLPNIQTGQTNLSTRLDTSVTRQEDLSRRLANAERAIVGLRGETPGWRRAEAEHLLRIANQNLTLARDVDGATAALQAADAILRDLAEPSFAGVRQLIAEELQSLAAVPRPDTEGMALKLGSLAAGVERLPIETPTPQGLGEQPEPEETLSGLDRALQVLRQAFDNLFSIRRVDTAPTPLLTPPEEYFLRRNLELQLLAARVALLNGDEANYTQSLNSAQDWLGTYFDNDDRAVTAALDSLAELGQQSIRPAIPDISGSLLLLSNLTADRDDGI